MRGKLGEARKEHISRGVYIYLRRFVVLHAVFGNGIMTEARCDGCRGGGDGYGVRLHIGLVARAYCGGAILPPA